MRLEGPDSRHIPQESLGKPWVPAVLPGFAEEMDRQSEEMIRQGFHDPI